MITEMMPRLPTEKYKYIRQTREIITAVAAEVMAEKQNDMRNGLEGGKDLMSLLLRTNAKENTQQRMSDEEINAGIT
jgi:cytochrome P450